MHRMCCRLFLELALIPVSPLVWSGVVRQDVKHPVGRDHVSLGTECQAFAENVAWSDIRDLLWLVNIERPGFRCRSALG
jgi:hypothetical protein